MKKFEIFYFNEEYNVFDSSKRDADDCLGARIEEKGRKEAYLKVKDGYFDEFEDMEDAIRSYVDEYSDSQTLSAGIFEVDEYDQVRLIMVVSCMEDEEDVLNFVIAQEEAKKISESIDSTTEKVRTKTIL